MTPDPILHKIKMLLNLASSGGHEGDTAKLLADKLIAKHSVSDEELASLADKPSPFIEENKLYNNTTPQPWKNAIALGLANKYYCYILQEETVPEEGDKDFAYYIYGDTSDTETVKFLFKLVVDVVNKKLEEKKISGKGPIYIDSYVEGLVIAIKENIEYDDLDFHIKGTVLKEDKPKENAIVLEDKKEYPKDKPTANTTVNGKSMIKDINAYFKGLDEGSRIYVSDLIQDDKEKQFILK